MLRRGVCCSMRLCCRACWLRCCTMTTIIVLLLIGSEFLWRNRFALRFLGF